MLFRTLILAPLLAVAACAPAPSAPTPTQPAARPTEAAAKPAASPAAAASVTAKPAAAAQPTAPSATRKVTAAYGFLSPTGWPLWAASDNGYWRKYGLDVELIRTENAARAVQALLGGSADIAFASGTTMLGPVVEGARIKILATLNPKSLDSLLARPGLTTAAQLKGGKVAVGALGDLSHLTAYLMLESLGLDPEKDVTYVQIGNDGARAAAVESGAVDAAPLNSTASDKLIRELGFPVLVNGEQQGITFPSVCVGTTQATFDKDPEMLKGFLKGILDGIDWVYDPANEQAVRGTLARELKLPVTDPAIGVGYRQYVPGKQFAFPPFVDRGAFTYVQSFTTKFNPKMADINVDSLLDQSLLRAAVAERDKK